MKVVRKPGERRELVYRYPNLGFGTVDLWLAKPPAENAVQTAVRVTYQSQEPIAEDNLGGNLVAHYRVRPFHTLELHWGFTTMEPTLEDGAATDAQTLTPNMREHYLRASVQIGREDELVREAMFLAGDQTDPVDIARAFFNRLARYRYTYPLRRRGALTMQRTERGDCGQFAALFVAWCRAVGIPAREVIGALVPVDAMNPHAWAEFWLDGTGWVPVDPSMASIIMSRSGDVKEASVTFGHLRPIRFAFSTDVDLPLPMYGGPVRPVPIMARLGGRIAFGGRPLLWGYETVDDTIPYFQPAYPRGSRGIVLNTLFAASQTGYWAGSAQALRRQAIGQAVMQARGLMVVVAILLFVIAGLMQGLSGTVVNLVATVLTASLVIALIIYQRPWVRVQQR